MTCPRDPSTARRSRWALAAALVAATALGGGCAGHSGRSADARGAAATRVTVADGAPAKYVPCGDPPVKLEKIDQDFLNGLAAAGGPPLYKMSYSDAREVLNKLQAGPVDMLPAAVSRRDVPGGPTGPVSIHVVRPEGAKG